MMIKYFIKLFFRIHVERTDSAYGNNINKQTYTGNRWYALEGTKGSPNDRFTVFDKVNFVIDSPIKICQKHFFGAPN